MDENDQVSKEKLMAWCRATMEREDDLERRIEALERAMLMVGLKIDVAYRLPKPATGAAG